MDTWQVICNGGVFRLIAAPEGQLFPAVSYCRLYSAYPYNACMVGEIKSLVNISKGWAVLRVWLPRNFCSVFVEVPRDRVSLPWRMVLRLWRKPKVQLTDVINFPGT